jgi:hypothetical protein
MFEDRLDKNWEWRLKYAKRHNNIFSGFAVPIGSHFLHSLSKFFYWLFYILLYILKLLPDWMWKIFTTKPLEHFSIIITKTCLMIIFQKQHREANKLRKQPRVLNPVATSCRSHNLISQRCRLMMEVGIGNHTTCNLRHVEFLLLTVLFS